VQSIQVHRDGVIYRQTKRTVTITPVFDKGDIWMTLSGGCGHAVMIPLLVKAVAMPDLDK
jgi:hypothetical protein